MKSKKSDEDGLKFVEYDDNNISHVMSSPDYGQVDTGSKQTAWDEISSKEYEDFVDYITDKIISRKIKLTF
jgi:hypothetical protein